jgi:hypothetical protein
LELAVDLLYTKANPFLDSKELTSKKDFRQFAEIYNFFLTGTNLVDRAGLIDFPIKYAVSQSCTLPNQSTVPSYQECCLQSAQQAYEIAKQQNKTLCVMYSGGIDSTLALLSLSHVVPDTQQRDIVVALSQESYIEYPKMYDTIIRKHTVVGSHNFSKYINNDHLIVTGEFNDQLFGSTSLAKWISQVGWHATQQPPTIDNVVTAMTHYGISDESARLWFHVVDHHIKKANVCDINTLGDFFWYMDFMFKWQNVNYRMPVLFAPRQDNVLHNPFFHFYATHPFQLWALDRSKEKPFVDDSSHVKMVAKNIIRQYTRDDDYFHHKQKIMSLTNLLRLRTTPSVALTSDYDVLSKIDDPVEYYFSETMFNHAQEATKL